MSSEICIVPTYRREELLVLSLEAIRKAAPTLTIKVFSDRGACSTDLIRVCQEFEAELRVRPTHKHFGNSYNLLSAMQTVMLVDQPEIIHLVEDDTIVHPNYFIWARKQLRGSGDSLPNVRPIAAAFAHCSAEDVRTQWYESPCASWDRDCLAVALASVPENYFADTRGGMQNALRAAFPRCKNSGGPGEQDSFFLCVIEAQDWRTVHPRRPLASHIGWYGYNRPVDAAGPTGTFPERVEACRRLLADKKARSKHFGARITKLEMEGMPT